MGNTTFMDEPTTEIKSFKLDDLTGIEKLEYLGYMFLFSERFPDLDEGAYEVMAGTKVEYERKIERLANPDPNTLSLVNLLKAFKFYGNTLPSVYPETPMKDMSLDALFKIIPRYSLLTKKPKLYSIDITS